MKIDFSKYADVVGRHYFGEPNQRMSKGDELRFGQSGSVKVDLKKGTWFDFEADIGGGLLDLIKQREGVSDTPVCFDFLRSLGCHVPEIEKNNKQKKQKKKTISAIYDYTDADGSLLFQVVRFEPKAFSQRRVVRDGEYVWSLAAGRYYFDNRGKLRALKDGEHSKDCIELSAVKPVPYRLPKVLAAVAEGQDIYIVEGEKDVSSLEALGLVATTNAGGSGKWLPEFSEYLKGARVFVLCDHDKAGINHAEAVCLSLYRVASEVFKLDLAANCQDAPEKFDITDWIAQGGDAVQLAAIVEAATVWKPSVPVAAFPTFRFGDLVSYVPKDEWLVDGWLGRGQLGVLYGKPKSGKSFVALDLAMSIAHGWPWLDSIEVQKSGVFYIAAEGGEGVKKRVSAWACAHSYHDVGAPFFMSPHRFDLFDGEAAIVQISHYLKALKAALDVEFRLIVVDTLARVFGGGDENFAGDMNRFIESCDRLRAETGCAVLLVHHSGKNQSSGMRGSSVLYGAVDTVWEAKPMEDADGNEIPMLKTLTLRDQKDGEAGGNHTIALRQRVLGHGADGKEITSCTIEPIQDAVSAPRSNQHSFRDDAQAARGATAHEKSLEIAQSDLDAVQLALEQAVKTPDYETEYGYAVTGEAWADVCQRSILSMRDIAKRLIEQGKVLRVKVGKNTYYAVNNCPF